MYSHIDAVSGAGGRSQCYVGHRYATPATEPAGAACRMHRRPKLWLQRAVQCCGAHQYIARCSRTVYLEVHNRFINLQKTRQNVKDY